MTESQGKQGWVARSLLGQVVSKSWSCSSTDTFVQLDHVLSQGSVFGDRSDSVY